MQTAALFNNQGLTVLLKEIESALEEVSEGIVNVFEEARNNEAAIVADALASRGVTEGQTDLGRDEVRGVLDKHVYKQLSQAKKLVDRFLTVTRKIQKISKKVEPWERLKADIKKVVYESNWFKRRFPQEYERRRRLRELPWTMETFRREHYGPRDVEDYRTMYEHRRPTASVTLRMTKIAAIDELASAMGELAEDMFEISKRFFGEDGPLVEEAARMREYLQRLRKPGLLEKIQQLPGLKSVFQLFPSGEREKREALGEILRIVEALFGYPGRPGEYVSVGGKAFLMPIVLELQEARAGIERLSAAALSRPEDLTRQLEQVEQEYGGSTAESESTARVSNRLRTRLGFQRRRRRRSAVLARLVSSGTKEDFNG